VTPPRPVIVRLGEGGAPQRSRQRGQLPRSDERTAHRDRLLDLPLGPFFTLPACPICRHSRSVAGAARLPLRRAACLGTFERFRAAPARGAARSLCFLRLLPVLLTVLPRAPAWRRLGPYRPGTVSCEAA
jgi:hypothetical protein